MVKYTVKLVAKAYSCLSRTSRWFIGLMRSRNLWWLPQSDSKKSDNSEVKISGIIGLWSDSSSSSGLIVDQAGIPIDSTYSGFWYRFDEGGNYLQVAVGSGMIISGSVVAKGAYSIEGNQIYLTDIYESFYPGPKEDDQPYRNRSADDRVLLFELDEDAGTLTLTDLDTTVVETYYRCYTQ